MKGIFGLSELKVWVNVQKSAGFQGWNKKIGHCGVAKLHMSKSRQEASTKGSRQGGRHKRQAGEEEAEAGGSR